MFSKNNDNIVDVSCILCNDDTFGRIAGDERRTRAGRGANVAPQHMQISFYPAKWFFLFVQFYGLKWCKKTTNKQKKNTNKKSLSDNSVIPQPLVFGCIFQHFLVFIHQDVFMRTFWSNLILSEIDATMYIQVLVWWEGDSWYSVCIELISLHWQPMWIILIIITIILHVTRELRLPASTKGFMMSGGDGGLYFVYRRIYGELLLIFLLYFNCHSNGKIIFKGAFIFLPPPQIVFKSPISGIFFCFCFTQLSSCVFLMNQTSMMLYYCMHFNFFVPR